MSELTTPLSTGGRRTAGTFVFTDIEGSTRLWEENPERMQRAVTAHNALARACVEAHGGRLVKLTGDGIYAAFEDALDALNATVDLERRLASSEASGLRIRCGLHSGVAEQHDGDYFGTAINRAARIMGAAHGGQMLVSEAVAADVAKRLPPGIALRDLGRVRLRDLSAPERVYQVLVRGMRIDFPPLRSLESIPNNLPYETNSFIRREDDIRTATALLAGSRLLTLTGAGGLGKTRLSLHTAAAVLEQFPDGVFFVELAPLTDARLVVQSIASALRVPDVAGMPVLDALVAYLEDRSLLLILDNCEHVVDGCAEVAKRLLRAARSVKLLATSREALRIAGETLYSVPPLSVPTAIAKAADVVRFEGPRLFVERARAAQPAFAVNDEGAALVVDICRHLDGIPLAIELAAARVRTLSLSAIAGQLRDRFRVLTQGERGSLPRQQTLRACIDWSYKLLGHDEREVFAGLGVFAGGFTLDAVASVTCPNGDEADALAALTRLVEKSLVIAQPDADRFFLLETIAEYASEKLRRSGGEDMARDRHFAFYLALAEEADPNLLGPRQGEWIARLDRERENLVAAHAWAVSSRRLPSPRLVIALRNYWFGNGLFALGSRMTMEALEHGRAADDIERCRALTTAAMLAYLSGSYADAARLARQNVEAARRTGDVDRLSAALQTHALTLQHQGDLQQALACCEESVLLARRGRNPLQRSISLNGLAETHRWRGDLEAAEGCYLEAIAWEEAHGYRDNLATSLLNLVMTRLARRAFTDVAQSMLRALAIVEDNHSRKTGLLLLDVLTNLCAEFGDFHGVARFSGAAEAQTKVMAFRREPLDAAALAANVARAREKLGAAEYATAEAQGQTLDYSDALDEARRYLEALAAPSAHLGRGVPG